MGKINCGERRSYNSQFVKLVHELGMFHHRNIRHYRCVFLIIVSLENEVVLRRH